jgi:hypothetical protein
MAHAPYHAVVAAALLASAVLIMAAILVLP